MILILSAKYGLIVLFSLPALLVQLLNGVRTPLGGNPVYFTSDMTTGISSTVTA